MKIAIFGATGRTGFPLVAQATSAEVKVKAIVRNEEKLKKQLEDLNKKTGAKPFKTENLETIRVEDIFNVEEIAPHLEDVDCVVSTLGFELTRGSTKYMTFTKSVVEAMKKSEKCKRLILMHSWYTEPESRGKAPFILRWSMIPIISPLLNDMREAEKFLQEGGHGIDYTVVCPPRLTGREVTDHEIKVVEDDWYIPNCQASIDRSDVARFILKAFQEGLYRNKIVSISI